MDGARLPACSVMATLVTCMLLVVNRILARRLYPVLVPETLDHPRVRASCPCWQ